MSVQNNSLKAPNTAWRKRNAPLEADFTEAEFRVWGHGKSIPRQEQELVCVLSRDPATLQVSCSHQSWCIKLKKNPHFKVSRVLLSDNDLILQLDGKLPASALTVRAKGKSLENEELPEEAGNE